MFKDIFKYAVSNLLHRRLRSFLSILSILIGIIAIFVLLSFGQGIRHYINDMSEEQGTDKIMMMAKGASLSPGAGMTFTDSDISYIEKINGVSEAVGMSFFSGKISIKDEKDVYTFVVGGPTDITKKRLFDEFSTLKLFSGRDLKKGDVLKAILGYSYTVPDRLIKDPLKVGDTININDIPVKVVGFYKEVGNPSDDSQVYLTFDGVTEITGSNDYAYLIMQSSADQDLKALATRVDERFRKHVGQEEGQEEYTVQTFADAIAVFTNIIDILNIVLVLIALVSVVVAAVNITNTMYTSVLERTSEIGVMKSLGSPNQFILLSFMMESGLLGFVGGLIGILIGLLFTYIGGIAISMAGLSMLQPGYPVWLFVACISFSTIIGLLAGLLPAKQASKMNPVDALRYE